MKYKIRDGIILKNICGEWLLIAVGEAAEHCLYVRHINETMAWYWQLIEKGLDTEQIVNTALEKYDVPEETIHNDVFALMNQLKDYGYLIVIER